MSTASFTTELVAAAMRTEDASWLLEKHLNSGPGYVMPALMEAARRVARVAVVAPDLVAEGFETKASDEDVLQASLLVKRAVANGGDISMDAFIAQVTSKAPGALRALIDMGRAFGAGARDDAVTS